MTPYNFFISFVKLNYIYDNRPNNQITNRPNNQAQTRIGTFDYQGAKNKPKTCHRQGNKELGQPLPRHKTSK